MSYGVVEEGMEWLQMGKGMAVVEDSLILRREVGSVWVGVRCACGQGGNTALYILSNRNA